MDDFVVMVRADIFGEVDDYPVGKKSTNVLLSKLHNMRKCFSTVNIDGAIGE